MNMKNALISILLLLCMLATFIACSAEKEAENTDLVTDADNSEEYSDIDDYVALLASEHSFNGADFCVLGGAETVLPEKEEETGNLENDALYRRSRELEELFDIVFSFKEADGEGYYDLESEINDLVRQDVLSSSASYDMINGWLRLCGSVMLGQSLLSPINADGVIDLGRSWWLCGLEEDFSIGGQLYYLSGKINLSHYNNPSCVVYNKTVAENFDLPDLYAIVDSGEWTLDKMYETASVIPASSDVKRYMIDYEYGLSVFYGGDFSLGGLDDNGEPYVIPQLTEDMVDYIEKIRSGFADNSVAFNGYQAYYKGAEDFYDRDVFDNDRVLYWVDCLYRASDMRPYDVEFGILPIPKRDTVQEKYIAFSHNSEGIYFEKNCSDYEMSEVITEAMAALSEKHVEPAFFEKALKGRSTYDEQSRAVLDMLYNARRIDLVDTYQWAKTHELLNFACLGINDAYVSSYKASVGLAKVQIKKLLAAIEKDG